MNTSRNPEEPKESKSGSNQIIRSEKKRRSYRKLLPAALLAALAVLAGLGLFSLLNSKTGNNEPVRIDLPADDFSMLCNLLDRKDVKATSTFHFAARLMKLDRNVRPGSYIVEPRMNTLALVRKLRNGQQDPIRLTIGKFRLPDDLNRYLGEKLMHNDFDIPLDSFHLVLPDTYEVYWTITPDAFMQRMAKESEHFWSKQHTSQSEKNKDSRIRMDSDSSVRDLVILASIVEEETNYGPEKPLIASVYLNRLRRGMPLQADPTVKYAVGDFTLRRILFEHLAMESPFNTYLHTGLPPAPICLPSKATIRAVLDATETDYLYFCASEQLDGTHRFAATLAEHNRNAARYHAAISKKQ